MQYAMSNLQRGKDNNSVRSQQIFFCQFPIAYCKLKVGGPRWEKEGKNFSGGGYSAAKAKYYFENS